MHGSDHGSDKENFAGKLPLMLAITLIGLAGLDGCAAANVKDQKTAYSRADPFESVNRQFYHFNSTVDDYLAKPIVDVYHAITPQFVQTGIFNFFNNLKNVNNVFNSALQGKFQQSADDTGRFLVNTTLGLGGIVDVAKSLGLKQNEEDFDQTLAVWGVPRGPYLVLPLVGPTTVRGIPGAIFDTAANPVAYVGAPVQLLSLLNTRANAEGALRFIDEAALDSYVFTREAFLQWRQNLARDGQFESLDYFEDFYDGGEAGFSGVAGFLGNTKKFNEAAQLFDGAARSFDVTAKSFRDASYKIDRLNQE